MVSSRSLPAAFWEGIRAKDKAKKALELRARYPTMTITELAQRTGVERLTLRKWLTRAKEYGEGRGALLAPVASVQERLERLTEAFREAADIQDAERRIRALVAASNELSSYLGDKAPEKKLIHQSIETRPWQEKYPGCTSRLEAIGLELAEIEQLEKELLRPPMTKGEIHAPVVRPTTSTDDD